MKLGADPEVFLLDTHRNQLVSVIGKIGGSKENPLHIKGMKKGFTLQEDNVALEFGIPPAKTKAEFVDYIQRVLEKGHQAAKGLAFSTLASGVFSKEELRHPRAHQFGCEPDFSAYTGKENPRPVLPDPGFRTCGGHVHVELDRIQKDNLSTIVKIFDLFLGIPSLLMDADKNRRSLYGGAGAFRKKEYGVEYRTLSNFWIFKPRLCEWVWDNVERSLVFQENLFMDSADSLLVYEAINQNDLHKARALIKKYDLEVV